MRLFKRFTEKFQQQSDAPYVCTLCGAQFEERGPVVCPQCHGFVVSKQNK